jgi:hypothetical protein
MHGMTKSLLLLLLLLQLLLLLLPSLGSLHNFPTRHVHCPHVHMQA